MAAQVEPAGNGLAIEVNNARRPVAVRPGATPSASDASPATIGAEKNLVPENEPVASAPGPVQPGWHQTANVASA